MPDLTFYSLFTQTCLMICSRWVSRFHPRTKQNMMIVNLSLKLEVFRDSGLIQQFPYSTISFQQGVLQHPQHQPQPQLSSTKANVKNIHEKKNESEVLEKGCRRVRDFLEAMGFSRYRILYRCSYTFSCVSVLKLYICLTGLVARAFSSSRSSIFCHKCSGSSAA